jgi:hypothetical protein
VELAAPEPRPDAPLAESAGRLLVPQVSALLSDGPPLLPLRAATLVLGLAPRAPGPALLRALLHRLLQAWRAEEATRERRQAEEDAMYRTKTYDDEECDEEQSKREYRRLVPSFNAVFADLVQQDSFGAEQEEKEAEPVPKDSSHIHEVAH